jgi:hypothetical protein
VGREQHGQPGYDTHHDLELSGQFAKGHRSPPGQREKITSRRVDVHSFYPVPTGGQGHAVCYYLSEPRP